MSNNTSNMPGYGMQYPSQHGNGGVGQVGQTGQYAPYGYGVGASASPVAGSVQGAPVQRMPQQVPLQQAPMPQPHKPEGPHAPSSKRKRGAGFYISIVIALAAVVAAGVLGYLWWESQQPSGRDNNAVIGQIEGKTAEEIQAELDRIIDEGMFNISIAGEVKFKDGQSEGALKIENSPANRYLMQVNITRNDTGDMIYQSGILDPNSHIQTAKLDQDLPAGVYECTATFNALDPETEELVGTAAAIMKITVEN